ncbi:MAG: cobalamin biosynthesis protein CobW [Alphaproteobacteria bacterium]|jgi:cobalamin biosynthesis protein CobW|nr:cobalamin biosynthesis protein CobW [Alphaproteobacteria bacterium]MDP6603486.1 cobalamin biosynthesis protein CobW [Rhodospirillales bacterium]
MTDSAKIPTTVVTGFLGSGKTTLIRHLLATANGRRLALIINEFGDIGVDGELLKACGDETCGEEDIVELANGCLCCTVADEFVPTIEALLARDPRPDHIVIETSGLALPKPLVRAFNWPEIRTRVTVDGVIAVVDGPAVSEGRFASDPDAVQAQREADEAIDHESPLEEVFEDQIACADLVVLNKADLLGETQLDAIRRDIEASLRPAVKVVSASNATIDAAVLLGLEAAAEDDLDARPSHHDGEEDHDHDDFESFAVTLGAIASPDELIERIEVAVATHDILRLKGFAHVAGRDMRLVVQAVGTRIQHYYDREWRQGESRETRLVTIGRQGLDRAAIEAAIVG